MITTNHIKYYISSDIDTLKWNRCISEADNGLIYAQSFYLDCMSPGWYGLVLNDYEAVMPLTWDKKYGFHYLYQPYFTPSLGIFGRKINSDMIIEFLASIPKRFRYWNIDLNEKNCLKPDTDLKHLKVSKRTNYHLPLNASYADIHAGYKKLCWRMLKKAALHQVEIVTEASPAHAIEFYRQHYERKHPKITSKIYDKLIGATTMCFEKGMAKVYLARLPDGEITAAYLVLVDELFIYFLIGGSSEKGKQTGSFYLITDKAIKDHAGSEKIFRFEGSDMEGVAFFNAQFGATPVHYIHLKKNELPFPINLFKR